MPRSSGLSRWAARRAMWLVLAIALAARAAFAMLTPGYAPHVDDRDYLHLAQSIAATGAYPTPQVWVTTRSCPRLPGLPSTPCAAAPGTPGARSVGRPTAYRPPGYPYALALPELAADVLGFDRLAAARVFQVLLGVLDVALLGVLARRLWGRRVGLVAAGLGAVYLPLVEVSGTLISEPLFVALLLGALCAALHRPASGRTGRWLVAAGVVAGLAALTRANGVLVLLAVAALAASQCPRRGVRHRLTTALVVLGAGAATVAPWTARNAIELRGLVPVSTETGGTLVGTYNPSSRAYRPQPATWLPLSHIARYRLLFREQSAHPETAIDSVLGRDAVHFGAEDPGYVASVLTHNTLRLLDLAGTARTRFTATTIDVPPGSAVVAASMFHVVALLALVGALMPRARRAPGALWLAPALLFLGTVLVTSETPRFRAPLEPFVLLLAALAVARIAQRIAVAWPSSAPRRVPER